MRIYLGNASVATKVPGTDDVDTEAPWHGIESVTYIETPDDLGPADAIASVVATWGSHSQQPPSWVAADDAPTANLLARQFGCDEKDLGAAETAYAEAAGVQA